MHEHLSEEEFKVLVNDALGPLMHELGFHLSEFTIETIWRHAKFTGHGCVVSVDYELPMHYAEIRLLTDPDGGLTSFDDPAKTFTLGALTNRFMPSVNKEDLDQTGAYFSRFQLTGSEARRMLEMIRRLSLVLPKWIESRGRT